MNTKKRYIPDPQVEPIALTEEQLRQLVREEVAKALAPIKAGIAYEKPKHDGKLDKDSNATVIYGQTFRSLQAKRMQGIYIENVDSGVDLDPQQALSLLEWLQQERETLELIAKDQEI